MTIIFYRLITSPFIMLHHLSSPRHTNRIPFKAFFFTLLFFLLFTIPLSPASTLEGTIYDRNLEAEHDVLLSINTTPQQQFLSKDGTFRLNIPSGTYILTAQKSSIITRDIITIDQNGTYTYDIFLLPSLDEYEDLWQHSSPQDENELEELSSENIPPDTTSSSPLPAYFSYIVLSIILIALLIRVIYYRRRFGPLSSFRKKILAEQLKTPEQIKAEIASEPTLLDRTIEIIKKHDGRIYQTELRRELNYLSEAKVSLIITELEHRSRVEKIKKGRGNIIILTSTQSSTPSDEHRSPP